MRAAISDILVRTFALAAVACSSAPAAPTPCDPLATTTLAINAGTFVGAGKDAAGTVYLIDNAGPRVPERLFISAGTVLKRRRVNGSGSIGGGPGSYLIVDTGRDDAALQVAIEFGASGPAKMGVHRGPLHDKTFTIGQAGDEVLTLLGQAALAGYALENLPGGVAIEHFATLPDGQLLLVTSPEVDPSYEEFRLFLGPLQHLQERDNLQVSRGSYTRIGFSVDGHPAEAVFGSSLAPAIVSELIIDGQSQPLTLAPPGSRPEGASFYCTRLR